jgi:excisionase family DNA binding protein
VFAPTDQTTQETTPQNGEGRATPTNEILTVNEVAELLRVPVSWVYDRTRKRSADRLPGIRLGKYWRFRYDDIVDWLRRQKS